MNENNTNEILETNAEPVVDPVADPVEEATAEPIAETVAEPAVVKEEVIENVPAGIVGAFLFSLAGGILWYVIYQLGFIASISAFIGVVAAIKGYEIFSKKSNIKGIIISVVIALIVIIIAWYLCLATDVYNAYAEWFASGDIDYEITFADAVHASIDFLTVPEIASSYIKDLLIGIVLGVVGCIQPVREALLKAKKPETEEEQQ